MEFNPTPIFGFIQSPVPLKKKYELKLVASDSLNENATTIVINVRDVNDLPPVFPQTLYERTLDEEMKAPFTIIQVGVQLLFFIFLFIFYFSMIFFFSSAINFSFPFQQQPHQYYVLLLSLS